MMEELVSRLMENGLYLSKKGDKLNVEYNGTAISEDLLEEIRSNKDKLLKYLDTELDDQHYRDIAPVKGPGPFELSSSQRRLWVLSQFEDASIAYNIPGIIYLSQDIEIESFKCAVESTIDRHEILRTVFKENAEGELKQWILDRKELGFEISYLDYRQETSKELKVKSYMDEDTLKAFDLAKGPLLRATLFQLENKEYAFYYNLHHIIGDGWSMDILSKDVFSYYESHKSNQEPSLKPLRIQYKDYSAWQLSQLDEASGNEHRAYWLDALKGELPLLDLPAFKPRPDVKTHNGRTVYTYLNKDLTKRLKNYAYERGGSLFIGVMSVLKTLLYKYSGKGDLVIGMQVAGRDHPDLENQIGFYVNSLALRSQLSEEDHFEQIYQKVRDKIMEAYSHQAYPFDSLVEELEQSRLTSRSAVFDITVVLQNTGDKIQELLIDEEKADEIIDQGRGTCIYDIKFDFQEQGEYLRILVEYNKDVYDDAMIEGFLRHYKTFVKLVLSHPHEAIGSLDYLSEAEKKELQLTYSDTSADVRREKTFLDVFRALVKKQGRMPALVDETNVYSYEELEQRSNQIAHFLINRVNLHSEEKVGLLLKPGMDTIAAMLGVMKAGGAYVPLDPALPEDRLCFMISDGNMRMVITEKAFIEVVNRIQWSTESLSHYLCIDSKDVKKEWEQQENNMMSQELWDHVGEQAGDAIAGGGWVSSYTGKDLAAEEMEEYRMNVYKKVKPLLHKNMRVLEIGCSSGLTLSKVAPEVGFYYGTDLSPVILANTKRLVEEQGLKNVRLTPLVAHEINRLEEKEFDLIIVNSVIQSFHGHNYLLRVLRNCIGLLKDEGRIFVGDVMDLNKKQELLEDLELFKNSHRDKGYITKTDFSSELFVSRNYFEDLPASEDEICKVEISEKIRTIENELTKFRYDVLLQIDKRKKIAKKQHSSRHKYQHSKTVLDHELVTDPAIPIRPDHLAYVLYTSGTTGLPKGVMIEHGSLLNYLSWAQSAYGKGKSGGLDFGLFTSLSFDLTITSIYLPLMSGGILRLFDTTLDLPSLLRAYVESDIRCIKITPAHISLLKEIGISASKLQVAIVGGDKLERTHVEILRALNPGIKIYNEYGPTEATVGCVVKEIGVEKEILIGKPIARTGIRLVNKMGQLVPVGVKGEIWIEGAGLARGYLNRKELTTERFVNRDGKRLYKTGDIGRWLMDGNIEFTGRKDDQVKVRGYRIELGEIEHTLLNNKQIEEAVVLAEGNGQGERELVAYITSKQVQNTGDLRAYLKERLPEYMLPAHYIQLEAMPLTSNGKINKNALPHVKGVGLASGVEYVAPENETEHKLAKIWEQVLKKENIGVKDDFFALGGHSLKAVRLINEYQKALSVKLSLKDLFTNTTIKAQAELIGVTKKEAFIQIEKIKPQQNYPISDAQRRLWVLSQFEDASVAYNMPGHIYLNRDININCFKHAIESTLERHEVLRTVFKEDEKGEVKQWVLNRENSGFKIDYRDFRNERDKEEKVQAYLLEDSFKPFDLEKGPLLRAALLQVENEAYVFYFNMHHIIGDGWSMDVLSKDVFSYYEAYASNKEPLVFPLRIQYKDYSAWQLARLESDAFKTHRLYWLSQLQGNLPLLDLPASKPRPEVKTHNGRTVSTYLNKILTGRLREYALRRDGSLFIGVMSVLKTLLYRYTNQQDLIIGMQVAGRDHADLENQIGFYVNSLVLRSHLNGEDSFKEVYEKVRQTLINAYAHQEYPFDRLVEELEQSRLTSRSAVFDVTAVLQNTGDKIQQVLIDESKIDHITEHARGTCIYDIKFDFQEQGDYLRMLVEYNKDVYEAEMIESFLHHFKACVASVLSDDTQLISSINYLSEAEKHELMVTFNATKVNYPKDKTVLDLFAEQVKKQKDQPAIVFNENSYSYEELNHRSNQVAHFLLKETALKKEEKVGLLLTPGLDTLASILGVLKAGGAYIPLDATLPEERLTYMITDAGMRTMITEKKFVEMANRLQWGIESLQNYLCVDSDDARAESEQQENMMMSQVLWDHVGESAGDQIAGGGWVSSYTGQDIPAQEMEEYTLNVYKKLRPGLHANTRVLEIGCSSGLTLSKIAPEVGFYYGTDLSPVIISNTKRKVAEKGFKNVQLKPLVAHEIAGLEENNFDLIIINSVIQSFHGHNYLLKVLKESMTLIKDQGKIFIGDVMDLNKKKDLIDDLEAFKKNNKDKGYITKTDFSSELFVSRKFFEDLEADENEITGVEITEKIRTIENELTRFRYDVILHIDKLNTQKNKNGFKHKNQYSKTCVRRMPETDPEIKILPGQLAYIIYTSGTTGKPKGVMIEHSALVNYLNWARSAYAKENAAPMHFGLFTSLSFDLTVTSIYLPLVSGGALSLFEPSWDLPVSLKAYVESAITYIKITPAHISLLKELEIKKSGVEVAIVGGDKLEKHHIEILRTLNPKMKIFNEYGPTESTVGCIVKEIISIQEEVVIGQPIANTKIILLNETGQLVSKGVIGEICISGEGLARGYLNHEELTGEKFIQNPYNKEERLYKTGDLGRWLPDGDIEYKGRKDEQVKIRGYRVELGEIENSLLKNDQIEEAIVLAKENQNKEKELVAYITSKEQQNANDLSSFLKELLPEYMLPSHYVQLESLPLTSNGKVNKKALPNPHGLGLASGVAYVAPRNETEKKLVKIWQEVLKKDNIGIKDDFFALGGHSLRAITILKIIHSEFSIQIKIKEIFDRPTVESISELLQRELWMKKNIYKETTAPVTDENRFIL